MASIKGILILTPFFNPNLGGVETHLDDLVAELNRHRIKSYVLTYSPLTTNAKYKSIETIGYCRIFRYSWPGYQLFPKLEKYPFFDFFYLTPYLLLRTIIWMSKNSNKISIIHSQGLNAAFIGNFISSLFCLPHLCSTHAVYENIGSFSRIFVTSVLNHCHHTLCLSQKSMDQLISWGVKDQKLSLYHYWVDLKTFKESSVKPKKFTALFVGRLIPKKGINILLSCALKLPNINFIFVGNGPLEKKLSYYSKKYKHIKYLGAVENSKLNTIYQQSSIFCIASQYPEGFGRVCMEAVASGIPVIGSNYGAIPEALNSQVSILFTPTSKNFIRYLNFLATHHNVYHQLQRHCRSYALKRFSSKNFNDILKCYSSLIQ